MEFNFSNETTFKSGYSLIQSSLQILFKTS